MKSIFLILFILLINYMYFKSIELSEKYILLKSHTHLKSYTLSKKLYRSPFVYLSRNNNFLKK